MKEWQVFTHLESCPGPTTTPKPPERNPLSPFGAAQRQHTRSLERLPALSYSMLKDNALRKKMSDLGISSQGSRALLEKRHKEWITLWNANCDAARPKTRSELLRDLDMWERTQGGRAPVTGRAMQNAAMIKDKDFDGSAWAAKHDTSFKDLIASARKSSTQAKRKQETEEPSGDDRSEGNRINPPPSAPFLGDAQQMNYEIPEREGPQELVASAEKLSDGVNGPVETAQPLPAESKFETVDKSRDINPPDPYVYTT